MSGVLLQILSQRPLLTGSGVIVDVFARMASKKGWRQHAVVGIPRGDQSPKLAFGGLEPYAIHPMVFEKGGLDFPVPGMSDVMPYKSTCFSKMRKDQIAAYKEAWREHLAAVIAEVGPDIIHAHHVWLVSSMLKDIAPDIPVVNQCHATGLRQMILCPHLAQEVKRGCRRNDRFAVAYKGHATELSEALEIPLDRIHVIGSGYNEELFHPLGRSRQSRTRLLYVGKLSRAKGVPWLLDAVESIAEKNENIELHVAGAGAGDEADKIKARLESLAPLVTYHGQLNHQRLADLMRSSAVMVLPSFYEGVPLVLVEALACGCRLVSTRLPGVQSELEPYLGDALDLVPMPRLVGADVPHPEDLDEFTKNLEEAIERAVSKPPVKVDSKSFGTVLEPFKWSAVFNRVEAVWQKAI